MRAIAIALYFSILKHVLYRVLYAVCITARCILYMYTCTHEGSNIPGYMYTMYTVPVYILHVYRYMYLDTILQNLF